MTPGAWLADKIRISKTLLNRGKHASLPDLFKRQTPPATGSFFNERNSANNDLLEFNRYCPPPPMPYVASLRLLFALLLLSSWLLPTVAGQTWLPTPILLRSEGHPEWSEFVGPGAPSWSVEFRAASAGNEEASTLRIRQEDVRQAWTVTLNGKKLGALVVDENPIWSHFVVPAGLLKPNGNRLAIERERRDDKPDDVLVGPVELIHQPVDQFQTAAKLDVSVVVAGKPTPCRITVVDETGTLVATGAVADKTLAIRSGTVYTLTGKAAIPLPAGKYRVYVGRGFEYSLAETAVELAAGEAKSVSLELLHEVPTPGYVACDTHVHSLTHSGHGDATVEERMVTLAGEGIELPIATDHNVNIDHRPFASAVGADRFFTPVIGNEVTTKLGHFNVFPITAGAAPPDYRGGDWPSIFGAIEAVPGVKMIILNHARDLHSGYKPFGPGAFNDAVGVKAEQWPMRATGMEILNSSATQTDLMQLCHDWMTLLNRGVPLAPVGCSDSHDVLRHFVGQGRTYVRCDDHDVSHLDVDMAATNFVAGRVRVSYGLLVEMTVADRWTSGETARLTGQAEIPVRLRVRGPHWVSADKLTIWANGHPVWEKELSGASRPGVGLLYDETLRLPAAAYDQFLVATATGPGIQHCYWRTAKPYQPDSPNWTPRTFACSGAVWVDSDGDGVATSARGYAERALEGLAWSDDESRRTTFTRLADRDRACAAQAMWLLEQRGVDPGADAVFKLASEAGAEVRAGLLQYLEARRRSLLSGSAQP